MDALSGYLRLAYYLNKNKKINGQSFNFSNNKIKNISVEIFLRKFKKKLEKFKLDIVKTKKILKRINYFN